MCIAPTPIFRTCVHFIRRNKRRTQKTSFSPPPSEPGRAQDPEKGPEKIGLGVFSLLFDPKNPSCRNHLFCPTKVQKGYPKTSFWAFRCNSIVAFFLTTNQQREAQKRVLGHLFLTFAGANKCFLNGAKINCHFCSQFIVFVGRKLKKMNQNEYFYWVFIANFVFSFSQGFYSVFSMHEKTL